jgi:type I restriction enzyme S subunit
MSINFVRFLQELAIINEGVESFVGEKYYMATGDLSNYNSNELESVSYENKPSRAALTAKPGDVIFARMKGTNKVLLITESESDYIFSTGFVVIRSSEKIDKSFLTHYLKSNLFQDEKDKLCTGATQKAINNQNIEKLKFPLPPLAIQKRIAEILDAAAALRRKDQELLKKYDELAQAIFIDMFGDPVKNEKGWETQKFGDLFESRLGKMLDAKKQTQHSKYKYLGNSNVHWFNFQFENLAEMSFDERELEIFELKYGDLLICEGGEVGRSAIWKNKKDNIYFQKAIHRARARKNNITSEYMVMLFWFYAKFGGFKDFVTTSTISHLTGEKLKIIPIPVPPIKLQNQFENKIELLNKLRESLSNMMSENLFNSLIQKAFKGELV